MSRDRSMISFVAAVVVFCLLPVAEAAAYNIYSGPNFTDRVVLTYDDCPDSLSQFRRVMSWVKLHQIGLVIAPTGNCRRYFKLNRGVDIVKLARFSGQYIINHSKSHPRFTTISNSRIRFEVEHGVTSNFVRPPFGDYNTRVLRVFRNMEPRRFAWLWNVDTNDWRGKTQTQVVRYVIRNSGAGDTVLMHLKWNGFSVSAIRQIVAGLERKGLALCRAWGVEKTGDVTSSPVWLPNRLPC